MRTAKPPKVRPVAENTSRLVRFETGRRLDDALASWVVASSDGSDFAFRARTSCTTTGVNSTAVASRLISTVTSIATADTTSTRRREELARLPIAAPAAAKSPASRATSASTNTAARNARVGASRSRVSPTASSPTSPVATTSTAAGPATHRSGTRPHATNPSTAPSTIRLPAVPTGGPYPFVARSKGACARQVGDGRNAQELVAVLGGGQLGRMLGLAGIPLGLRFRFLDPTAGAPAAAVGELVVGALGDEAALAAVARDATVVTYEWEGVPADAARFLAAAVPVRPGARSLEVSQDRLTREGDLPPARHRHARVRRGRRPRRARPGDRRGRRSARGAQDPARRLRRQGPARAARPRRTSTTRGPTLGGVPLILEALVPFDRELSVLAVRGLDGEVACWPLVENHHEGGILRVSRAPAPGVDAALQTRGEELAASPARRPRPRRRARGRALRRRRRAAGERDRATRAQLGPLDDRGRRDQPVREPPPRHPRAAARRHRAASGRARCSTASARCPTRDAVLSVPGAHLHDYGKAPRPGRKLGHVTVTAGDDDELTARLVALGRRLSPRCLTAPDREKLADLVVAEAARRRAPARCRHPGSGAGPWISASRAREARRRAPAGPCRRARRSCPVPRGADGPSPRSWGAPARSTRRCLRAGRSTRPRVFVLKTRREALTQRRPTGAVHLRAAGRRAARRSARAAARRTAARSTRSTPTRRRRSRTSRSRANRCRAGSCRAPR